MEYDEDYVRCLREVLENHQNHIKVLENELNGPESDIFIKEDPEGWKEANDYLNRLRNFSTEDFEKEASFKRQCEIDNENLYQEVMCYQIEDESRRRKENKAYLFSQEQMVSSKLLHDKSTGRIIAVETSGNHEKNIRKMAKLTTVAEAKIVMDKIVKSGLSIASETNRIVLYDETKFFDFQTDPEMGKLTKNGMVFVLGGLNEWDFIEYVKKGCHLTKKMKSTLVPGNIRTEHVHVLPAITKEDSDLLCQFQLRLKKTMDEKHLNDDVGNIMMTARNIVCSYREEEKERFQKILKKIGCRDEESTKRIFTMLHDGCHPPIKQKEINPNKENEMEK